MSLLVYTKESSTGHTQNKTRTFLALELELFNYVKFSSRKSSNISSLSRAKIIALLEEVIAL